MPRSARRRPRRSAPARIPSSNGGHLDLDPAGRFGHPRVGVDAEHRAARRLELARGDAGSDSRRRGRPRPGIAATIRVDHRLRIAGPCTVVAAASAPKDSEARLVRLKWACAHSVGMRPLRHRGRRGADRRGPPRRARAAVRRRRARPAPGRAERADQPRGHDRGGRRQGRPAPALRRFRQPSSPSSSWTGSPDGRARPPRCAPPRGPARSPTTSPTR